jgi:hypothetical protein
MAHSTDSLSFDNLNGKKCAPGQRCGRLGHGAVQGLFRNRTARFMPWAGRTSEVRPPRFSPPSNDQVTIVILGVVAMVLAPRSAGTILLRFGFFGEGN